MVCRLDIFDRHTNLFIQVHLILSLVSAPSLSFYKTL